MAGHGRRCELLELRPATVDRNRARGYHAKSHSRVPVPEWGFTLGSNGR